MKPAEEHRIAVQPVEAHLKVKKERASSALSEMALSSTTDSRLTSSSSPITGFAGPGGAIFPLDATAANVAAQATLPIPSVNVATPANF